MKHRHFFSGLLLACLSLLACNPDKPAEVEQMDSLSLNPAEAEGGLVDSLTEVPEDGVSMETPAEEPVAELPPAKPAGGERPKPRTQTEKPQPVAQHTPNQKPADNAPASALKEGSYRLLRVQGEALPLMLDMTTECDVQLLNGELQLRQGQVHFQSFTAEECAGHRKPPQKHEAAGSYRVEGTRIHINITSGDALGDAVGQVEGSSIRLQQISNDEEQQEVDWLFQLQ